jgi:hypothetical protein
MRKFLSVSVFIVFVILFSACSEGNPGGVQGRVDLNLANELASKDLGGTTVRLKGTNTTTTTDANGNFSLKNIKSGKYTFTVSREDYETVEVDLEIEEYSIIPLNVVLPYSFGVFKGRFSSDDAELTNATLELTDSEGKKHTAEIGKFGVFKFDKLAEDEYSAEMIAEGFTPYIFEVEIEKDKVLDIGNVSLGFNLGGVSGKISPEDGGPGSGFSVQLLKEDTVLTETQSGSDGAFRFSGIEEGDYSLLCSKDGYVPYRQDIFVERNRTVDLGTVSVLPGGADQGIITVVAYMEDKNPDGNSGITVTVLDNSDKTIASHVSDSFGKFRFVVTSGRYKLVFSRTEYNSVESTDVTVEEGKVTELEPVVMTRKTTEVYGYITLPGSEKLSGAVVNIDGAKAVTDSNGFYDLTVPVGTRNISITIENYETFTGTIVVPEDDELEYDKVLAPLPATLEGFAELEDEEIYIGIKVTLTQTDGDEVGWVAMTETKDTGYFRVDAIPYGVYRMEVEYPGFATMTVNDLDFHPNQKKVFEHKLTLVKVPTTGSLYGYAALSDSPDKAGITVSAIMHEGPTTTVTTAVNGTYVFPTLAPGIYDIQFTRHSYLTRVIEDITVEVGHPKKIEEDIILQRASGLIAGTAQLQGWSSHEGVKVELLGDYTDGDANPPIIATTDGNGSFSMTAPIEQNYTGLKIYKDQDFETYYYNANFQTTAGATYRPVFGETVGDPKILIQLKATVKGKVTINGAVNHSGILVELHSKWTSDVPETFTDTEGNYQFNHVPITDLVDGSNYIVRGSFHQCGEDVREATVVPGEFSGVDSFMLFPNSGSVTGTARLKNMTNHSGITVALIPDPSNVPATTYHAMTNSSGSYSFGSVLAGDYTLSAVKTGWDGAEITTPVTVETFSSATVSSVMELVDSAKPVITQFLINGGSELTTQTESAKVIVTVSASDSGSGLDKVMLSENSDFSGAVWQDYSYQSIYHFAPGDGPRTLYTKVKDKAGNESTSHMAQITLVNVPDMANLVEYLEGLGVGWMVNKNVAIEKNTYLVDRSVVVLEGYKMTIQPGTIFYFKNDVNITVLGWIQASGTETQKIQFRPFEEGDTYKVIIETDNTQIVPPEMISKMKDAASQRSAAYAVFADGFFEDLKDSHYSGDTVHTITKPANGNNVFEHFSISGENSLIDVKGTAYFADFILTTLSANIGTYSIDNSTTTAIKPYAELIRGTLEKAGDQYSSKAHASMTDVVVTESSGFVGGFFSGSNCEFNSIFAIYSVFNGCEISGEYQAAGIDDSILIDSVINGSAYIFDSTFENSEVKGEAKINNTKILDSVFTGDDSSSFQGAGIFMTGSTVEGYLHGLFLSSHQIAGRKGGGTPSPSSCVETSECFSGHECIDNKCILMDVTFSHKTVFSETVFAFNTIRNNGFNGFKVYTPNLKLFYNNIYGHALKDIMLYAYMKVSQDEYGGGSYPPEYPGAIDRKPFVEGGDSPVIARGNWFGTVNESVIAAKIHDKLNDAANFGIISEVKYKPYALEAVTPYIVPQTYYFGGTKIVNSFTSNDLSDEQTVKVESGRTASISVTGGTIVKNGTDAGTSTTLANNDKIRFKRGETSRVEITATVDGETIKNQMVFLSDCVDSEGSGLTYKEYAPARLCKTSNNGDVVYNTENGMLWETSLKSGNRNDAYSNCENLTHGGISGWYLPHFNQIQLANHDSHPSFIAGSNSSLWSQNHHWTTNEMGFRMQTEKYGVPVWIANGFSFSNSNNYLCLNYLNE